MCATCRHQWRMPKQIAFVVKPNVKDSSAMCSLRKTSLSRKKPLPKKPLRKKQMLMQMVEPILLHLRKRLPPRKLLRKKLLRKKQRLNL